MFIHVQFGEKTTCRWKWRRTQNNVNSSHRP